MSDRFPFPPEPTPSSHEVWRGFFWFSAYCLAAVACWWLGSLCWGVN